MEKQKIEFTFQEASQLWAVIDNFLTAEIPEGNRIRILDLLARKYLNQVADKLWAKVKTGKVGSASKIKISLSPEQIIAVYSCIELSYPGTPASVAQGKIQQKALNYDRFINLKN